MRVCVALTNHSVVLGDGGWGCNRFLVMHNVFNNPLYPPIERYDLKGSTYGRTVPIIDRDKVTTLKDQDILDSKRKFFIPEDTAILLRAQISKDTTFLAEHDLMDYSLLVGISYDDKQFPSSPRSPTIVQNTVPLVTPTKSL